tara:strand:- start:984 stop:1139 length:156 start_codon:yes stop_codon:yes gene_type:complete
MPRFNSAEELWLWRIEQLQDIIARTQDIEFKRIWLDKLQDLMREVPTRLKN